MKYLIITGVFVLGLSLGYIIGNQNATKNIYADKTSDIDSGKSNKNETDIYGNGHHRNDEKDQSDQDENISDELLMADSLNTSFFLEDSLNQGDQISTEKMIRSIQFPIVYLAEEESGDTTMSELLGIENVQSMSMFVEFWESPLNFEGYKLSKKKLIVYGLSPQFDYKLYKEGNDYYLSYQNVYYKMKETQDFLPFTEVTRSEVFND